MKIPFKSYWFIFATIRQFRANGLNLQLQDSIELGDAQ
ncbi:hypothetical protein GJA_4710 [Janthinobacterium agaricidamnosum NBRC 102515 = DSM 9628]|uniref:Uncharacterized protein n=1 Tax=Janthinobacterium agaricidamnosum NBRC 102515 = DSM 9628 TaxID=1349767 RepID=W0VCC1_9BURK|nr:hypothetical protein GJA_4710 [Janthinobacterium agaricidamnosum NBRC 102515 = DSM 9628]